MAPALFTLADVDLELALTADYRATGDVDKARRRVTALTRKLDFPETAGKDQESVKLAMQTIENQLQRVEAWLNANTDQTADQQLRDPNVTHADFSSFRGYSRSGFDQRGSC